MQKLIPYFSKKISYHFFSFSAFFEIMKNHVDIEFSHELSNIFLLFDKNKFVDLLLKMLEEQNTKRLKNAKKEFIVQFMILFKSLYGPDKSLDSSFVNELLKYFPQEKIKKNNVFKLHSLKRELFLQNEQAPPQFKFIMDLMFKTIERKNKKVVDFRKEKRGLTRGNQGEDQKENFLNSIRKRLKHNSLKEYQLCQEMISETALVQRNRLKEFRQQIKLKARYSFVVFLFVCIFKLCLLDKILLIFGMRSKIEFLIETIVSVSVVVLVNQVIWWMFNQENS